MVCLFLKTVMLTMVYVPRTILLTFMLTVLAVMLTVMLTVTLTAMLTVTLTAMLTVMLTVLTVLLTVTVTVLALMGIERPKPPPTDHRQWRLQHQPHVSYELTQPY